MKIVKTFNSEKFSGVVLKVNDLIATFPLLKGRDIISYKNTNSWHRIWLINAHKIRDFIQCAYEASDNFSLGLPSDLHIQFSLLVGGKEQFNFKMEFDFKLYSNAYPIIIVSYLLSDVIMICSSLYDYDLKLKYICPTDQYAFINSNNVTVLIKKYFYDYAFAISAIKNGQTYVIAREVIMDSSKYDKVFKDRLTVEEGTIFDGNNCFIVAKNQSQVFVFNGLREFYRHQPVDFSLITTDDMSPDNIDEFCAKISGIRIPGKS